MSTRAPRQTDPAGFFLTLAILFAALCVLFSAPADAQSLDAALQTRVEQVVADDLARLDRHRGGD